MNPQASSFARTVSVVGTSLGVSTAIQFETPGHFLALSHVAVTGLPSGGENVDSIDILFGGGAFHRLKFVGEPGAANDARGVDWQGEVLLSPGDQVLASVNFNAAVQPKTVTLTVWGFQRPFESLA